jgi:hypothetical protein
VDVAYVDGDAFVPIEVKWTHQVRPSDLRQIRKYPNGRVLTSQRQARRVDGIRYEPVPVALLNF